MTSHVRVLLCLLSTFLPLTAKTPANAYLGCSPCQGVYGDSIKIGVVVPAQPSSAPVPTGTAKVGWDSTAIHVPLDTTGYSSFYLPSATLVVLGAGPHTFTATYDGDANYSTGSSDNLTITIAKVGAVVTLGLLSTQVNQATTLKAVVTLANYATTPVSGTVDFTSNGSSITGCTAVPVTEGAATCHPTFTEAGNFTIAATYSGDSNVNAGSNSALLTVGKMAATAYLTATPTAPAYGDPASIGVQVLGATGAPKPTGNVIVSWGGNPATVVLDSSGHGSLPLPLPPAGTYTIGASYNGDANYQAVPATPFQLVVSKAGTVVAIGASALQINQPVTLRATISLSNWANMPMSGTVDFSIGGNALAGCTGLALQNAVAVCTATFAQLGGLTLNARYNGDPNTNSSTGSLQLSVGKVAASAYLAVTPTAPVFGAPMTITALVLGASGVAAPTGNVTFRDGSATIATLPLNSSGQAVLAAPSPSVPALAAGTHTITATYNGDASYVPSAPASLNLTVGKASTVMSLAAGPGGPFVATIAVQVPGSGTPTGTVQFLRNGAPFTTAPVVLPGPSATVSASSQGGNISAVYAGDSDFSGSTSAPVSVAAPFATVVVASDHNPSGPSQAVKFTVYVSPISGTATPTGTVQLSADGTSLGTAQLNAAQATFTASPGVGTHAVSASYAGDAVYPAASAAYSQVVSKTAAALTLSGDVPAALFGQNVTLTAKLAAPAGSAQPGGDITFSDGPNILGTGTLTAGSATLTVTNLAAGQHPVTASWAGDSNWSPAVSQAVLLSVSKAPTNTTLTATTTSLTVSVTAVPPGGGTPTGTIRLTDATTHTVLASTALNAGSATMVVPSEASAIVAEYAGDASFLGSASSSLMELVATNAASYATDHFAADEIVTLFGNNLATATAIGGAQPQATLGGVSVQIADANGKNRPASLLFVSPSQISLVLPAEIASGPATVSVSNPNGVTVGPITLGSVAPGLFTASGAGQGPPAGQAIRVHPDGSMGGPQDLATFDATRNLWNPVPIDLSAPGDTVYLVLYGTGFRHFHSIPTCTLAGQSIATSFAGAQPSFAGLDQINLPLPPNLQGAGTTTLTLSVDGVVSNPVTVVLE